VTSLLCWISPLLAWSDRRELLGLHHLRVPNFFFSSKISHNARKR